jgi:hypothetical protein
VDSDTDPLSEADSPPPPHPTKEVRERVRTVIAATKRAMMRFA